MGLNMIAVMLLMVYISLFVIIEGVCPNNCSGHGKCDKSVCKCFSDSESGEFYLGNDCSIRGCSVGNPFGAVHSKSPSENGLLERVVNKVVINRELSECVNCSRILEERIETPPQISLINPLDVNVGKLWKVSGLKSFFGELPPSGGTLSCKFTPKSDGGGGGGGRVLAEVVISYDTVEVLSYGEEEDKDYEYVLFKEAVQSIGETPAQTLANGKGYKSVECDRVISIRDDLSQLNPAIATIPAPVRRRGLNGGSEKKITFEWKSFGPILLSMGLLKPNGIKNTEYVNSIDFKFACYKSAPAPAPAAPTVHTPSTDSIVEVYDKVTAVYDTTITNNYDIELTFAEDKKPTVDGIYTCLCLMNWYETIDIEYSLAFNNIRSNKDKSTYNIGKYVNTDDTALIIKEDNYPVYVSSTDITTSPFAITFPSTPEGVKKYEPYFEVNRVVYATILRNGIFIEEAVTIDNNKKVTITTKKDGDIIMPYLRTSPLSKSTPLPTPNIILQTPEPGSGPYIYKAYYFAEKLLLNSFNKEGGILKCKYEKTGVKATEIEIDVKGISKDEQTIFFSYFEASESDIDNSLICDRVISVRKDLTLLYPSTFEVGGTGRRQRELDPPTMTWSKYGYMFKDLGFENKNAKFACFNMKSSTKEIKEYTSTFPSSIDSDSITFSITPPTEPGTYLCYLMNLFTATDKKSTLELKELPNSEIGNRIKFDGEKYYYGEFVLGDETILGKRESDGSEVIILNSGSNVKIEKVVGNRERERRVLTNGKNTITITNYISSDFDITKKLEKGSVFYMKMIKTESPFDEENKKITVETITATKDKSKTVTITVEEDVLSYTAYSPFYVIYLSEPKTTEKPTSEPVATISVIDINNNLYKIHNYISDELLKELSIIGGKLQCKNENNKAEIVDVKGIIKDDKNEILGGFYEFEDKNSINKIMSCKIMSSRKDMTVYNPIKYEKSLNSIVWIGYGTILSGIGFDYNPKNLTCYNPNVENIEEINNREFSFYEVSFFNIAQSGSSINDLKMSFNNNKKPSEGDICYLLSDENGKGISIEDSELWSFVRKDEISGKYYFGKNIINIVNGKSDEIKEEAGNVKMSFVGDNAVLLDDNDKGDKMNIYSLNDESSPSFEIPSSFIGIESEKMLYPGTTIVFTFIVSNKSPSSQSSQILRIEKDDKTGRFKIYLSDQISIPKEIEDKKNEGTNLRLRSLDATSPIKSTDIQIELNWLSEASTHIAIECSGQGICDRSSGLCKCYNGFSGSACQRLDCPNNCNGNGRCVALSELLSNAELSNYEGYGNKHIGEYIKASTSQNVEFDNQVYGCLCDKRHRGYDCSLIECPSGEDPEGVSNQNGLEYRDCSGRGICDYSSGICKCFDGFVGEGCQEVIKTM